MDSAIHWINLYPVDKVIGFPNEYLLDSDFSGGQCYLTFERLGPVERFSRKSLVCGLVPVHYLGKERGLVVAVKGLKCKTVCFFFSKSVKKSVKSGVRVLRARSARALGACEAREKNQSRSLFSASFQTFCLTARAYLNTVKYGLFCSL